MNTGKATVAVINRRARTAADIAQALEDRGFSVATAPISEASLLLRHHPDAIVFDVEPSKEVMEAFSSARDAGLLRSKVLLVTTEDARQLSTLLRPSDRAVVFEKPFQMEQVASVILELLRQAA